MEQSGYFEEVFRRPRLSVVYPPRNRVCVWKRGESFAGQTALLCTCACVSCLACFSCPRIYHACGLSSPKMAAFHRLVGVMKCAALLLSRVHPPTHASAQLDARACACVSSSDSFPYLFVVISVGIVLQAI